MSSTIKPVLGSQIQLGHHLADGLVGCWLFNEGTGSTVYDLSGNGNAGTFGAGANSPTWSAGKFGPCPNFDGGDAINLPDSDILMPAKLSIIAWIYMTTLPGRYVIVSLHWNDVTLEVNDEGAGDRLYAQFYNGVGIDSLESTVALVANRWYQVALTFDGSTASLYIDGAFNNSGAATVAWEGGVHPGAIGADSDGDGFFFNGLIDTSTIYNYAISASDVALLYREQFCMFERDPIELWSAATLGAAPVGAAGIMTTNTGFWGPTF